jgi:hypothetical protein
MPGSPLGQPARKARKPPPGTPPPTACSAASPSSKTKRTKPNTWPSLTNSSNNSSPAAPPKTNSPSIYADCQWRLNRIAFITESIAEDLESGDPDIDVGDRIKSLANLALYERRVQSTMERALAVLKKLQAERKAEEQAAIEAAVKLEKLAQVEATEWNPAEDGFVFSRESLSREVASRERLELAESHFRPAAAAVPQALPPSRRSKLVPQTGGSLEKAS